MHSWLWLVLIKAQLAYFAYGGPVADLKNLIVANINVKAQPDPSQQQNKRSKVSAQSAISLLEDVSDMFITLSKFSTPKRGSLVVSATEEIKYAPISHLNVIAGITGLSAIGAFGIAVGVSQTMKVSQTNDA